MAAVVGFAFLWLSVTPVGKLVFLRVVAAFPQRHALHGDNSRHGSKSGLWPFKKAAFGGKKTAACVIPTIWRLQIDNKVIFFVPAQAGLFVPAQAGLFLPPKADFLYLLLFSLPSGRRE